VITAGSVITATIRILLAVVVAYFLVRLTELYAL